jgi:hypothetical protein
MRLSRPQIGIGIFLALMGIGALFPPDETPAPVVSSPAPKENPLRQKHNGVTGQEFIDFCMDNAGAQLLTNPQTAKHPNLLQQNAPYLSTLNDWAWQGWVEGANLYGVTGRVNYVCWRDGGGGVNIEAVE